MRSLAARTLRTLVSHRPGLGITLCAAVLIAGSSCRAALIDKAMGTFAAGNPIEARRLAQAVLDESPNDARALLIMARTETGGRSAQSWAEQAITAAGNRSPADEALVFLIELHAATQGYGAVLERAARFFQTFGPQNPLADAVRWWAVVANLALGRTAAADSVLQQAVDHPTSSPWNRRLRLLFADSRTDSERAVRIYKKLLKEPEAYIENQSLLGLMNIHQQRGEIDRALLYRGMLNEKFPNTALVFPGADTVEVPAAATRGDEAEKLAGVVYTVQLGAFSDNDNAVQLRDKHQAGRWPVHFFSRDVAGKTYWVVQVGAFTSLENAKSALEKLQREDGATYRVVVR